MFFDGDLPVYFYNRKKVIKTIDGKYAYFYPDGDGLKRVDVTKEVYELLQQADRDEYNNDRSEHRHRGEFPAYTDDYKGNEDDAEYDPWWNYPNKKSFGLEDEICEKLDREAVLATLEKEDRRIYHYRIEKDRTQSETAEILGISQSTVSRKLKEINAKLERQFLTDGDNTEADIDFYVAWNELCATGKTKDDYDVLIIFVLRFLAPDDLCLFLHWFYGLKELSRFIMKFIITRAECMADDIEKFSDGASAADGEHFDTYYADKPPIMQCVYVNLLPECRRRMWAFSGVTLDRKCNRFNNGLEKIAKRLKLTEAEFLLGRFLPMLMLKRIKRLEEFIKKYKIEI